MTVLFLVQSIDNVDCHLDRMFGEFLAPPYTEPNEFSNQIRR